MELIYLAFFAFVIGLLALDLGVLHRRVHAIGVREAIGWSALWIGLGVAFSAVIYLGYEHRWLGLGTGVDAMAEPVVAADGALVYNDGTSALIKYLTGFVIEKSLAVDNIFVIAMIFGALAVPPAYQHRALFWGILGALVMRGVMIAAGAALLTELSWIVYVFGALLVLTGFKMLLLRGAAASVEDSALARLVRRVIPITERYHGARFFVRAGSEASRAPATPGGRAERDRVVEAARRGARLATPLLLALVLVEVTDLIFAADSIPAIFAITADPFLVLTSNVFAMLGMRSLYFALAGMLDRFRYLKPALAVVLVVVGAKMLAHGWLEGALGERVHLYALAAIGLIIAAGVAASLLAARRAAPAPALGQAAPG